MYFTFRKQRILIRSDVVVSSTYGICDMREKVYPARLIYPKY